MPHAAGIYAFAPICLLTLNRAEVSPRRLRLCTKGMAVSADRACYTKWRDVVPNRAAYRAVFLFPEGDNNAPSQLVN